MDVFPVGVDQASVNHSDLSLLAHPAPARAAVPQRNDSRRP